MKSLHPRLYLYLYLSQRGVIMLQTIWCYYTGMTEQGLTLKEAIAQAFALTQALQTTPYYCGY